MKFDEAEVNKMMEATILQNRASAYLCYLNIKLAGFRAKIQLTLAFYAELCYKDTL